MEPPHEGVYQPTYIGAGTANPCYYKHLAFQRAAVLSTLKAQVYQWVSLTMFYRAVQRATIFAAR